jgi:hypothetical protein
MNQEGIPEKPRNIPDIVLFTPSKNIWKIRIVKVLIFFIPHRDLDARSG